MTAKKPTDIDWICNTSVQEGIAHIKRMLAKPITAETARILREAELYETSHQNRGSLVETLMRANTKVAKELKTNPAIITQIPAPSALMDGDSTTFLSPSEVSALAEIDRLVADTAVMISRTKGMLHAGTAGKALSGINLLRIREHYLGERKKGRPAKTETNAGFPRWKELLESTFEISDETANNWIKTGQAVLAISEAHGTDLRTICEKLPWHWTPEETSLVKNTLQSICKDKTQRQLMQADFLESLGFENKQDKHGTNNPGGKNGGKKQPPASPKALLEDRRRLARLGFYGTENPGKIKPGSPVWHIEEFLRNPAEHPLSSLPKAELLDLLHNSIQPLAKALKDLTA